MIELFTSGTNLLLSILGVAVTGGVFAIISNHSIDRIPRNQSLIKPDPYCRSCATLYSWKEQIPIWSYLSRKGRCPYCGDKIPARSFIIEIVEIFWVAFFILKFGWSYQALIVLLFGMALIAIIVIEYENSIMSDLILLIMLFLSIIYLLAYKQSEFPLAIIGMIIGGSVMMVYNLMKLGSRTHHRMDYSEIKMGAVLGLFFGAHQIILCIFLSWMIGAVLGSFRIKFLHKKPAESIPQFPTILAFAGIVTVLFNTEILQLYSMIVR